MARRVAFRFSGTALPGRPLRKQHESEIRRTSAQLPRRRADCTPGGSFRLAAIGEAKLFTDGPGEPSYFLWDGTPVRLPGSIAGREEDSRRFTPAGRVVYPEWDQQTSIGQPGDVRETLYFLR